MAGEVINITDGAFDRAVLRAGSPVVAAFWSRRQEGGDRLQQALQETVRRYAGEVRVVRVEATDAPQAAARYSVDALPEVLFFRDGRLVARARGLPSAAALRPWVDYLLGRGPAPKGAAPAVSSPLWWSGWRRSSPGERWWPSWTWRPTRAPRSDSER